MNMLKHIRCTGVRWAAGLPVLLGVLAASPAARAQDKLPPAEKILEKTIAAQGGKAAFDACRDRVLKGTFTIAVGEQKVEGTIERFEAAPDKRYFLIDFGQQGRIEGGTDGDVYWTSQPSGTTIDEGEERAISQRRSAFNGQLLWREHYPTVECTAKEDVDGEAAYKVVLTPELGPPVNMFYSAKTGLPIKVETTTKGEEDTTQTVSDRLEDYRKVDGVLLPFKITRTVTSSKEGAPPRTYVTIWKTIEHNTDIPASKFELSFLIKAQAGKVKKKE